MSQAPKWELESEYPAIESKEFQREFALCEKMIAEFPSIPVKPAVGDLAKAIVRRREIGVFAGNLAFHCGNLMAADTKDELARKWAKKIEDLRTDLKVQALPYELAIQYLSDDDFQKLISDPQVQGERYLLERKRLLKDQMLSREEETVLEKMYGPAAASWAELHDKISATMEVPLEMDGRLTQVSLGRAQAMTKGSVEKEKKAAWLGLQKAWKTHEHSAAQALNAMADWSFRQIELRSRKKKIHFLDHAFYENRISRQTLETMMAEIQKALPRVQKSLVVMANILGKPKLDSWDLISSGPESAEKMAFGDAFSLIEKGFKDVDPELSQFAKMMLQNKWIEASDDENKAGGGYCMAYPKSRHPRIFQTFKGSFTDTFTVAHELGHAFHAWVVRDMPLGQTDYPSTLAETASTFGEFALFDYLQKTQGKVPQVSWLFLENMHAYLINVVARFHFEKAFYEKREQGVLSAQEISDLQVEIWKQWYGDHLNQIETHFWANKAHFYWPGPSFYNFPYTVGYLLSYSIYAQREKFGKDFWQRYKALLRDTGVMTCEEIIQKHLGYDIRQPQFWREGLESLIAKI